jgi:membrane protein required for colicin V production
MFLDLLFVIILVLAIVKGYQRGLIVGIFSFVAVIIGLAAAIKLSAVVAGYIGDTIKVSNEWLPVISFAVVFILVVLLIRLGANMIQKTVEISMLGWVNRLGGILLYIAIYGMVYSVVLFYAEQLKLLQPDTIEKSVTYSYVQPWGPKIINGFASVVPVFKGMFTELESFFDGVAQKMAQ